MKRGHVAALSGAALLALAGQALAAGPGLRLDPAGYLAEPGLNVMAFSDYYPDGHQTGVTIIQHGVRVAANGDLRLEAAPGQWSPMPATGARLVDPAHNSISRHLSFPDPAKDRTGFNPIVYPDLKLGYSVTVTPGPGDSVHVRVDLDQPLPARYVGKLGFNLELFPGDLFGKTWLMDKTAGVFARQPSGPMTADQGATIAAPLATGHSLTVAPETDLQRLGITSQTGALRLIDARGTVNNGWFVVRELVPAGATKNAIEWTITPHVVPGWTSPPVLQVSQVGYAPDQPKTLVIEQDAADTRFDPVQLLRITADGPQPVESGAPAAWGRFLRYGYATWDFSSVREPGLYRIRYRGALSEPFRIGADIYDRGVWQPTLDYFLPIQMCHMRVEEKYRVWHGLDHVDDALMAPVNLNHFDGYAQGPSTLTRFKPLDHVPGLDAGGWHDAGDYDLRIESQMGTVWLLAKMIEEFGLDYDATTIDETHKRVLIHQPDGRNDAVQQIEHGLLSVLGGYHAMGRLYRGIQDATLAQYTLLGEAANATDNIVGKPVPGLGTLNNGVAIRADDRLVFTEDNPARELTVAAQLATVARVLRASSPAVAADALATARTLFDRAIDRTDEIGPRVFALAELAATTGEKPYLQRLVALKPRIVNAIADTGWMLAPVFSRIDDAGFRADVTAAVATYEAGLDKAARADSPYGVPYKPDIWGAGWTIQEFGVQQWLLHKAWPQLVPTSRFVRALDFVLGVHPGSNTAAFASGVGARSVTTAYGFNRADWSYVPGGVVSGTALIRPDLPELKVWPYFWQQTEYVLGGGETNYMFLVLAARQLYAHKPSG
ncbi:glycoside hydrolase family 9 protein [Sphingomonas morindae]|uniref:Glycoside hydrolase family 9 protein n=1 Tax=Sphingomonas morindae TaxID=1541170 RepID=A0ABY4XCR1_9SPHN|nr:glycoside hydrolase family 9 protein [Sphingomonas morindae]USI74747.1 glycoside hydrolase family 9 protein [Sphingomonas morindae]